MSTIFVFFSRVFFSFLNSHRNSWQNFQSVSSPIETIVRIICIFFSIFRWFGLFCFFFATAQRRPIPLSTVYSKQNGSPDYGCGRTGSRTWSDYFHLNLWKSIPKFRNSTAKSTTVDCASTKATESLWAQLWVSHRRAVNVSKSKSHCQKFYACSLRRDTCSICLEELDTNRVQLECKHAFHLVCMRRNVRHGNHFCPNCRKATSFEL